VVQWMEGLEQAAEEGENDRGLRHRDVASQAPAAVEARDATRLEPLVCFFSYFISQTNNFIILLPMPGMTMATSNSHHNIKKSKGLRPVA
jgi:hypothetical protein